MGPPVAVLAAFIVLWFAFGGGGGCNPVWTPPPAPVVELVQNNARSLVTKLSVGADGNIYGSTSGHRLLYPPTDGTVFRVDGAGALSTIHTFPFSTEGTPSSLTLGSDNALYGVTSLNVFFRVDQDGGYTSSFVTLPGGSAYAGPFVSSHLMSELVLGSDGAFYGALEPLHSGEEGGYWFFDGGVARITSTGAVTLLGGNLGLSPAYPFVVGSDGALYGSRDESRYGGLGAIVRWDAAGAAVTLHQYTDQEAGGGRGPSGFTLGNDGLLYAVHPYAGTGFGAVFRFDNAGNVTVLHEFDWYSDGANPSAPLAVGSNGAMYGVTENGGSTGLGTIFKINPNGAFSTLFNGGSPDQTLFRARDGSLWSAAGVGSQGLIVYRVDPAGHVSSWLGGPSRHYPSSPLVQGNDCALYGVAGTWDDTTGQPETAIYRVFEPGHLCQHIEFGPLPDRNSGAPLFTVHASASSRLSVSFSASGSCTVTGDQVTLAGGGLCTLTASQVGDANYQPATEVSQTFRVMILSSWGCGIGPELALLLAPLWWLRRRRES